MAKLSTSHRFAIEFPSADPGHFLNVLDINLAITELSGSGFLQNRLEYFLGVLIGDKHFDLEFWNELHFIFRAAIDRALTSLASIALNLSHGEPGNADRIKRVPHFVEPERLDDRDNLFHWVSLARFSCSKFRLRHTRRFRKNARALRD